MKSKAGSYQMDGLVPMTSIDTESRQIKIKNKKQTPISKRKKNERKLSQVRKEKSTFKSGESLTGAENKEDLSKVNIEVSTHLRTKRKIKIFSSRAMKIFYYLK